MKTSEKEKLYLNQYDVILPNTYRHVISSHESERVLSVSREREGGGGGGLEFNEINNTETFVN